MRGWEDEGVRGERVKRQRGLVTPSPPQPLTPSRTETPSPSHDSLGEPRMNRTFATLLAAMVVCAAASAAPPAVTVAKPLERETAHHDFKGRLEPAPVVEVRAPLSGVVSKVAVKADEHVKKGDLLCEIDAVGRRQEL